MTRPSLPEKLGGVDDTQQSREMELYRRHLIHYRYLQSTAEHNELHYTGCADKRNEEWGDARGRKPAVSHRVRS